MSENSTRPRLTLLGDTDAISCEGDACVIPSLAEVTSAVEKAFRSGL
ncbi:hypothetical protein [Mycetocola zhujimingii]|nr:hypothetical protein [Mycetocola zhujimingii]